MGNNLTILAIFSIGTMLVLRGYMSTGIRVCQTKNERKGYAANASIVDRWFFWTAPKIVKDRYSKFEKKMIHYSSMVKVYRAINLVIHIALAVELIFIMCYALGFGQEHFIDRICIAYFAISFLSFVLLAVVEFKMNSRYHRSRYGSGKA